MSEASRDPSAAFLRLCDACCDRSGTAKEMVKTGGCTCDICGFSCGMCGDAAKQFVNRIPVRVISPEAWEWLLRRNECSLVPLDFERLFAGLE